MTEQEMINGNEVVSTIVAADLIGVSVTMVHRYLEQGLLDNLAENIGKNYSRAKIPLEQVVKFERPKRGRPNGSTKRAKSYE